MDFPAGRRGAKDWESLQSGTVLQTPLATAWSRLVLAQRVCVLGQSVCVFILSWPVGGLGGRFSFGRPECLCACVCVVAPVRRVKASRDASHFTARVPGAGLWHHTSRTLELNQAAPCQREAPDGPRAAGTVSVFRRGSLGQKDKSQGCVCGNKWMASSWE